MSNIFYEDVIVAFTLNPLDANFKNIWLQFSSYYGRIIADDVRFRHDDMKPQKSLVVESNYDYTPKRKDELKLKRGATIKVIRRDGLGHGIFMR